ncbi:DUF4350 domain-containing protein [[Mycobacterium] nativiensis]|uniref:DUF4350 domain-containing protein n=1 Tax=[Mycobacterium] nativiensis TaxID=2855503 RepID=A0ABU5Y3R9_9MYCO|nr:DUF4350 domain-containing protein [Mycolicibacter sp. MYC340]MEB3034855.1 DUF4350 domain-containing protein [Mycolicibacter sp. MYC340]
MTATRRTWLWAALALAVIVVVAAVGTYLGSPRPGGRMDANATGPDGAHALVALLRDRGVQVVVADTVADVAREARSDTLVLVAQTQRIADDALVDRLAQVPGDLLLVAPDSRARNALAPAIQSGPPRAFTAEPGCRMRAAERAGSVDLRTTATYAAKQGQPVRSCYQGALVRYHSGDRTITVIGSESFMTNTDLAREGNAALAMNLAGSRDRLIWYAPQRIEGGKAGTATISELIPSGVRWLFWQLCVALALAALWKGRRLGPLVAEPVPVVVRASETVEGLGRLYRSRRARDRAAAALRSATLRRLAPRLGLGPAPEPGALVAAVTQRIGGHPDLLWHILFGPAPDSDDALVRLAHALDDIERQVTHS